jgi:DNA-binding response OmpR family regulator
MKTNLPSKVPTKTMRPTILIVDDKHSVQQLLVEFLQSQGFDTMVAINGLDALQKLKQRQPDLVLLDIMMPLMDGHEFLKRLRTSSELPVIIMSAQQQEEEVVAGFELGADDYITKPFRMMELLARLKAVLKRSGKLGSCDAKVQVGLIRVDLSNKEVYVDDKLVDFTKAEYALLVMLMKSVSHAVPKAEISCQLIEQGFSGSESTLKIHIRNLRNKLMPHVHGQLEIESVFGVGYRLREAA